MSKQPPAEPVFEQLRADILAGWFVPGSRLRYADLCQRYGTSMGVARESMLRLVEQGLATGEPQHGFSVTSLSAGELVDLTDARVAVESAVLKRAIEEGDVDWEAQLLGAHHRLDRTELTAPAEADRPSRLADDWVTAHKAFHDALLAGCTNRRLKDIASSLRDSGELYRNWSLPFGLTEGRNVVEEHSELLSAALDRDTARAVDLLVAHIRRTTDSLLASPARLDDAGASDVEDGGDHR